MDKLKKLLEKRNKTDIALLTLVVTVVLFLIIKYSGSKEITARTKPVQEVSSFTPVSEYGDLKMYFTKQIDNRINASDSKVKEIENQINVINEQKDQKINELNDSNQALNEQISLLREELKNYKENHMGQNSNKSMNNGFAYDPNIIPAANNRNIELNAKNDGNEQISMGFGNEIEIVSVDLKSMNKPTSFKNIDSYLPAGTHIRGVILGGVEAHTEVSGTDKTRVVTIRLVDGGSIPNDFKGQMTNCVVLASAWGNASSERVAMRGERISCVGDSGRVLETDIVATVYGPDGRQDVRGRVVYPESKLLQRAFYAGSLSGIGNGLANSLTSQSISPLGATNVIPNQDIFKFGAAQGVGKGLDKLADYYIKRAEQLQPVIQVGSGVEVDIVVQKGFYLDGRAHNDNSLSGESFTGKDNDADAKKAAEITLSSIGGIAR